MNYKTQCPLGPETKSLILSCSGLDVPQAGITLARALMNLTARLCDGTVTAPTAAARATEAVLPVLLQQGLTHPAREVRAVSIQTLIRVVKTAGPLMRPHLAALLTGTLTHHQP
jgi:proteasome component ECM29